MTDHIAAARARVDAHGRSTPELRELGAVLDALDIAINRAELAELYAQIYLDARDALQRARQSDAVIIDTLRADLAMLKRPRAVPLVGTMNDGVVANKPPMETTS